MAIPVNPALTTIQGFSEYKQAFRWKMDFSALLVILAAQSDALIETLASSDTFSYLCQSTEEPKKELEIAQAKLKDIVVNQAGIGKMAGEITFKFIDNTKNHVQNIVDTWSNLEYQSKTGSQGTTGDGMTTWGAAVAPQKYKCSIDLYRLDGLKKPYYGITLLGTMYKNSDRGGALVSGNSELSIITLTVAYDGWVRSNSVKSSTT